MISSCPIATREPQHKWLVFTHRRAGSRWFVNVLQDRSGGAVVRASELALSSLAHDCFREGATGAMCSCALRRAYATEANKSAGTRYFEKKHRPVRFADTWVGMKMMLTSPVNRKHYVPPAGYELLADTICRLGVRFVFMWRRNVLRR